MSKNVESLTSGPREWAGRVVGATWALPVAAVSLLRHARMFHPRGVSFVGRVEAARGTPYLAAAEGLEGHALMRFSGALFKEEVSRFEVLGAALRISSMPVAQEAPRPGDQDLLLATIVSPLSMPLSPLTTSSEDYTHNHYWGVAPFRLAGVGRVKLRLGVVGAVDSQGDGRAAKLESAVAAGGVRFALEVRRTLHLAWEPLLEITLDAPSAVDEEALRFDPFRAGRGLEPVGFVHAIRKSVYRASQAARPKRRAVD